MNKAAFIEAISEKTGFTKTDIDIVVKAYTEVLAETLAAGGTVRVPGLGIFKTTERKARPVRNLMTHEMVISEKSKLVKLAPAVSLKARVNGKEK